MKKTIAFIVAAAAAVSLSACGSDNFRDVEGVNPQDADSYRVYNNVDGNPNLTVVCISGVAFVTTTREYGDAVNRVPELDATCVSDAD